MNAVESANKNFQLLFFNVGDGNSCLVRCPDDTVVVVDFGSDYEVSEDHLEKIRHNISTYVKENKIKALVLSSPRKSRYNKIAPIFKDYTIENVYYSCGANELWSEYPLDNYLDQGTAKSILHKNTGSPFLKEVTINQQNQITFGCPFNYQYEQGLRLVENIDNSKLVICNDTANNAWEISIVSGNVQSKYPHMKRERDSASLVTYIRNNEYKALMLSDASDETQEFLEAQHPEIMQDMMNYPVSSYNLLFYPAEILSNSKVTPDGDMQIFLGNIEVAEEDGEGVKE